MSLITRIVEKIFGMPHQHNNAAMVERATDELLDSATALSKKIRSIDDPKNPLEDLIEDIRRQRQERHRDV